MPAKKAKGESMREEAKEMKMAKAKPAKEITPATVRTILRILENSYTV